MKPGRNSSHQSRFVVAVFGFLLTATFFSAQTPQSSAVTPEEKRARAAVEKFVNDGQAKDYLNAALNLAHELNSKFPGKPYDAYNTGIADGLKDMAGIKAKGLAIPRDYDTALMRVITDLTQAAAIQNETNLKSFFENTPNAGQSYKKLISADSRDGFVRNINKDIKAADATAQEPAPGGQGKQYDPTKSVGLGAAPYRDMLKGAALTVDHLLANANVDQTQAQSAAALERAATINKSLEPSRKLPDLVVKSVAAEAPILSADGLEKMRGDLQKLIAMANLKADSDEVDGTIDTFLAKAKSGAMNPNSQDFEKSSAALKQYVSAALRNAEIAGSGATPGAGRKAGVQRNLQ